jgi:hypothetical protein
MASSSDSKNEVLLDLTSNGLAPSDFNWRKVIGTRQHAVDAIEHRPTGSFFVFDGGHIPPQQKFDYVAIYSPGGASQVAQQDCVSWAVQRTQFQAWVSFVKREASSPDLWAVAAQERGLLLASEKLANAPFDSDQQKEIARRLDEIERYLFQTEQVPNEQVSPIKRRFAYLKDAATRLGQLDWLNLTVGTFLSVVAGAALPPEAVRAFFQFAWHQLTDTLRIAN